MIIGSALKVHRHLGPGLLESAYEAALSYQLRQDGLLVEEQRAIPMVYETVKLDCGFRSDLIVNGKVVVELKAVELLNEVHIAQVLTHLKLLEIKLGLLINFNVVYLRQGIRRVVNGLEDAGVL